MLIDGRYRRNQHWHLCRPHLDQCLHWNKYIPKQYRTHKQVDFYESTLRPFAMYRDEEKMENWKDFSEKLGIWSDAFTKQYSNISGKLEHAEDFTKPRSKGRSTRRRDKNSN